MAGHATFMPIKLCVNGKKQTNTHMLFQKTVVSKQQQQKAKVMLCLCVHCLLELMGDSFHTNAGLFVLVMLVINNNNGISCLAIQKQCFVCVLVISCNVFCHAFLSWLQCEWLVAVVDDEHAHNTTQHTMSTIIVVKKTHCIHNACLSINQSMVVVVVVVCALCHPIPFSLHSLFVECIASHHVLVCVCCVMFCAQSLLIIAHPCCVIISFHTNQINQCVQCNNINKQNKQTMDSFGCCCCWDL